MDDQTHNQLVDIITSEWLRLKNPTVNFLMSRQFRDDRQNLDRLLDKYAKGLGRVPLARCPFCSTLAQITIDLVRLDGPWWTHRQLDYQKHEVCKHFILLSGAIQFSARKKSFTATRDVYPGPSKPYILPELLNHPKTIAVINQLSVPDVSVTDVHTAYPVLYFSERLSPDKVKHHSWGWHGFVPGLREQPWAFNLIPSLEDETLWWIEPGDQELKLQKGSSSPYHHFSDKYGSDQTIREGRLQELQALDHDDLHWA